MIKIYEDTKRELSIVETRIKVIKDILNYLEKELFLLEERHPNLKKNLFNIENDLNKLTGIEYKLYYQIAVKGVNVTRAIDKVAFEVDKDASTLWKNYYPKIKENINKLKIH